MTFGQRVAAQKVPEWHIHLMDYFAKKDEITTKLAAVLWKTTDRTARTRLRKLVREGLLAEVGTGPKDPKKTYVLKRII